MFFRGIGDAKSPVLEAYSRLARFYVKRAQSLRTRNGREAAVQVGASLMARAWRLFGEAVQYGDAEAAAVMRAFARMTEWGEEEVLAGTWSQKDLDFLVALRRETKGNCLISEAHPGSHRKWA